MFSRGVERALRVALQAHEGQTRKGVDPVPYASHPIHVALLLARCGATDEVVQAGLLHDVLEDVPDWTAERLEREFGPRVRAIVAELTEDKSRSWQERKECGLRSVPELSPPALLVKACDTLHNLRTLADEMELAADLEQLWKRFRGGREETLRMSRRLAEALGRRVGGELASELALALEALEVQARRG